MKAELLKRGTELTELIDITRKALNEIKKLIPEERTEQAYYDDKLYYLNISKHRDGSGISADLCRYYGNARLVKVIEKELESQLKEFEDEFDKI